MRLTLGVLSIILSVIVFLQSLVAMLVSGILTLAGKDSKGTHITAVVFWTVAGLLGFMLAGNYSDLNIWSGSCILFAALSTLFIIRKISKDKGTIAA